MTSIQPTHFNSPPVAYSEQTASKLLQVRDAVLKFADQDTDQPEIRPRIFNRLTSLGKSVLKSSIISFHRRSRPLEHNLLDGLETDLAQLAERRVLHSSRLSESQLQLIVKMATHDDAIFRVRVRDQLGLLLWSGVLSSRVIYIPDFSASNPHHISELRYRTAEIEAYLAAMNLYQGASHYARHILSSNVEYRSISIEGDATLEEKLSCYLDPQHRVQKYQPDRRGTTVMFFDAIVQHFRRNS